MKYMLMMNAPSTNGGYKINNWAPEDFKAHIAFMHSFNKGLAESGELVQAEGLDMPSQARVVRANATGAPVTDGVFPETKEFLAGFWIVETDTTERAFEIAAQASAAPGPGGKSLNMAIEVRQVMSGPPPQE